MTTTTIYPSVSSLHVCSASIHLECAVPASAFILPGRYMEHLYDGVIV